MQLARVTLLISLARRHFYQSWLEVGHRLNKTLLLGHDLVNIIICHGYFIKSSRNQCAPIFCQDLGEVFEGKLFECRRPDLDPAGCEKEGALGT